MLGMASRRRGSRCRLPHRVWGWLTRDSLNKDEAAGLLALLNVPEDGIQIVIETSGVLVTDSTNFIDNRIVHGFASNSSSGVQMMGAIYPLTLQTCSMTGLIAAFARCRQFHVSK